MSRTLIVKGASWANAISFMIASTNLVFEIFLVIVTLLGWAFFGGEILGGILFILIGTLIIRWLLTKRSIDQAKQHIEKTEASIAKNDPHAHHANMDHGEMDHHHHDHKSHESHGSAHDAAKEKGQKSSGKWREAAGYFYMDVVMVGKDILIGVVLAAILAVVVPQHFWEMLFLKNDTQLPQFLIILWNTVIGMLVALLAFVCSVGNILLAAVLWHGGINFGGVIAFILADLITIPMLMVYRRYYGIKMMWRLLLVLSLSILLTGLAVDYIFQWAGWIPQSEGGHAGMNMPPIEWNYKTVFNIILLPLSVFGFFVGKKMMK